jgi:hypothetical protein
MINNVAYADALEYGESTPSGSRYTNAGRFSALAADFKNLRHFRGAKYAASRCGQRGVSEARLRGRAIP